IVSVRLKHKATGKPVTDAVIVQTRIDMSPDAMGEMASPLTPVPRNEPDVYSFKTDLSMQGRWLLSIAAKVHGKPDEVVGKISFEPGGKKPAATAGSLRKILYYRNPMGLPDTSPVPKKDWMGMDYIPVYEGEAQGDDNTVKVSLDRVQRSGVRTEAVEARVVVRPVRAVGTVMHDESRLTVVTMRSDGFVEDLFVSRTGQHVHAGEPLFRVYSVDIKR